MAGLSLMGNVRVAGGSSGFSSSAPNGGSATEMAFGPGYTQQGAPSGKKALIPNDPFGIGFWAGCVAVAALLVVRHSLPR